MLSFGRRRQRRDELPWSTGNAEHFAAGAVAGHPAFVNQELMECSVVSPEGAPGGIAVIATKDYLFQVSPS